MQRKKIITIAAALFCFAAFVTSLDAQTLLLSQDFEGSFPPAGWTQNPSYPSGWRDNTLVYRTNYTGGGGKCADRDDDRNNYNCPYPGCWFRTPAISCSGYTTVWLAWSMSYNDIISSGNGYDKARVEVSNNGTTWTMLREWNSDVHAYGPGYRDSVNITAWAAGQATVYVRFMYYENSSIWGWWFEVDRVMVWGTGGGGGEGSQPDNMIKNSADASYIGDNIYNLDGTNQTKAQTVDAGTAAVYHIRIQNDGDSAESFNVTGTGNGTTAHATWTVTYYDALSGGSNITAQVTSGGWSTGSLNPGASREIRVEVMPNAAAWGFESYSVLVTSTSANDPTKKDAVKAVTTVKDYYQPDNLIKRTDEAVYTGDNIYNANGANQTKSFITNFWTTKTFQIRIENDKNTPDVYNVTVTSSGAGWTARFYDALSAGNDITGQLTSTGWPTGTMNPGSYREIRLEVTGSSTSDTMYSALITSTSTLSTSKVKELDAVKAVVVRAGAQPDALIKNPEDQQYVGDDVYNLTGANQTKEQLTSDTAPTAVFYLKIQNDYEDPEVNPDIIEVKASKGDANWIVRYFNALQGGTDITNEITGTGWHTPALKTKEYKEIRAELTPADTSVDSSDYIILVSLTSTNDGNRKDAVKAVTTYKHTIVGVEERPQAFAFDVSSNRVYFSLPKETKVSLLVYDVTGRVVATLASATMNAGSYTATWDSSSGVYFVKLVTPEFSEVRKAVIIK